MNKYKEILDSIEFSFSTLHIYDQCPYAFYRKKICEDEGDNNAYAEVGSAGHYWNEKIFNKNMTVQEALEDCIENFDNMICEYISESSKDKKYEALCDYFADFDNTYEEKYEVLGVEKEFHWKIGRYKCIGFADLILKDRKSKKILLIDHKSAGHFLKKDGTPLKNQISNFEAYKKQMYMYADAMKKEYGFYPDYLIWNHFLDNCSSTIIPFDIKECELAVAWAINTIKTIYRDTNYKAGKEDYTLCNILCNYRNECDYKELRRLEE